MGFFPPSDSYDCISDTGYFSNSFTYYNGLFLNVICCIKGSNF